MLSFADSPQGIASNGGKEFLQVTVVVLAVVANVPPVARWNDERW
jgi:hypothetical protein